MPADEVLKHAELMVCAELRFVSFKLTSLQLLEVIGFDLHVYSTRRVASAIVFDLCEEVRPSLTCCDDTVNHFMPEAVKIQRVGPFTYNKRSQRHPQTPAQGHFSIGRRI